MPLSQESKVVELKYAAKRFGVMAEDERRLSAHQILLKIHAITGWTVPVSELMEVLVDQFEKKLSESYANVNEQEIEYAFRNKGIDIKDWGKALNLTLIDEVMIPYLENRFDLSRVEENLNKPVMIEENKLLTNEEKAEWIMEWKAKDVIQIELIPLIFYDFLTDQKIINVTSAQKWEYTAKATTAIKVMLHEDMNLCKTNNAYIAFNDFCNMEVKGFEGDFKNRILSRAKRLIVFDYLKDAL